MANQSQGLENIQGILEQISQGQITDIGTLITILQAAGIIFIIYLIFLIINFIINFKKSRRIKNIEQKVNHIDEKLDKLLKAKIHKEEKK